ncbi:MAG: hypothetical protein IPM98_15935 [Lewinellaceae bacterium]|nr:hypothetical protein [Lewinellaceae bacterium]
MQDAFLHGFRVGVGQWRIAAIVYVLQLCLALTVGMQVYEVLDASIGNSLEINKLLRQYDHTVVTDFLKVHGASITPLLGQLRWLLLVWLLFSVFLNGGLLYCAASPEQASGRSFWQGGAAYFFPFLKISLFFLPAVLLWTGVLWLPIAVFLERALEYLPSEKHTVWGVLTLAAFWLAGLGLLFVWAVLSRLQRLTTGASAIGCIIGGGRVFLKTKCAWWLCCSVLRACNWCWWRRTCFWKR